MVDVNKESPPRLRPVEDVNEPPTAGVGRLVYGKYHTLARRLFAVAA